MSATREPHASPLRRLDAALTQTWRSLSPERRAAGLGALLLIVSTLGPFSFVEGAIVLVGLSILVLLRRGAVGRRLGLPFPDGAVIAAAGASSAVLILLRLFSRPLGQGLLALVCATIILLAGLREARGSGAARRPERPARRTRPRPRARARTAAREIFGADPPEWTTPSTMAAEPPSWSRPKPVEQPPPRASDGVLPAADESAQDPAHTIPPANPVTRAPRGATKPPGRR